MNHKSFTQPFAPNAPSRFFSFLVSAFRSPLSVLLCLVPLADLAHADGGPIIVSTGATGTFGTPGSAGTNGTGGAGGSGTDGGNALSAATNTYYQILNGNFLGGAGGNGGDGGRGCLLYTSPSPRD